MSFQVSRFPRDKSLFSKSDWHSNYVFTAHMIKPDVKSARLLRYAAAAAATTLYISELQMVYMHTESETCMKEDARGCLSLLCLFGEHVYVHVCWINLCLSYVCTCTAWITCRIYEMLIDQIMPKSFFITTERRNLIHNHYKVYKGCLFQM